MWSGRSWKAQAKRARCSVMREDFHRNFSTEQTNTSTRITSQKKKKMYPSSVIQPLLKTTSFVSSSLSTLSSRPSTSWPTHVQQTVWVSPGIVHRAPRRCVRHPQPTVAPQGADSVHKAPGHGRSRWPRPLYRGSPVLVTLPWKFCQCFGKKIGKQSVRSGFKIQTWRHGEKQDH